MIEARGIAKSFGSVVAVAGVDLSVAKGQIVALIGENGAGKTTVLRLLSGYLEPDVGTVVVCGHDLSVERQAALQKIAYVPESAPLYPEMRVREYLRYRACLKRVPRLDLGRAVGSALERTATHSYAPFLIGTLSRGQRQRVALADALLGQPQVLILDEPTAGLDPVQVREFVKLVGELSEDCAIVMASHVLTTLSKLTDDLIVLARGAILARGDAGDLRIKAGLPNDAGVEDAFAALVSRESA